MYSSPTASSLDKIRHNLFDCFFNQRRVRLEDVFDYSKGHGTCSWVFLCYQHRQCHFAPDEDLRLSGRLPDSILALFFGCTNHM